MTTAVTDLGNIALLSALAAAIEGTKQQSTTANVQLSAQIICIYYN